MNTRRRIEVSIPTQTLTAYEGDNLIFKTRISSGLAGSSTPDGGISTDTPKGEFHIESKMPSKHMGSGELTSDYEAYVLPGVPWTSFFVPETGVAFHGTYWHDNYGVPMSHGCVNMRPSEALWLFRWSTPIFLGDKMEERGYGTACWSINYFLFDNRFIANKFSKYPISQQSTSGCQS